MRAILFSFPILFSFLICLPTLLSRGENDSGAWKKYHSDPPFSVNQGLCTANGSKIYSPNYPSNYNDNDYCEIELHQSSFLYSLSFHTETCCDKLMVNGLVYAGTSGLDGVFVKNGSIIQFTSDYSITESGFSILASASQISLPTPSPTAIPELKVVAPILDEIVYAQEEIVVEWSSHDVYNDSSTDSIGIFMCSTDSQNSPPYYFVLEGGCTTDSNYLFSPNYPANYNNYDSCVVTVLTEGFLYSSAFRTESCCDKLTVDGYVYSGSSGPNEIFVRVGSQISFTSDGSFTDLGFSIYLETASAKSSGSMRAQLGISLLGGAAVTVTTSLLLGLPGVIGQVDEDSWTINTCSSNVYCQLLEFSPNSGSAHLQPWQVASSTRVWEEGNKMICLQDFYSTTDEPYFAYSSMFNVSAMPMVVVGDTDIVTEMDYSVFNLNSVASFDLRPFLQKYTRYTLTAQEMTGDFDGADHYVDLLINGVRTGLICNSVNESCGGAGFRCFENIDISSFIGTTDIDCEISFLQGIESESFFCSSSSSSFAVSLILSAITEPTPTSQPSISTKPSITPSISPNPTGLPLPSPTVTPTEPSQNPTISHAPSLSPTITFEPTRVPNPSPTYSPTKLLGIGYSGVFLLAGSMAIFGVMLGILWWQRKIIHAAYKKFCIGWRPDDATDMFSRREFVHIGKGLKEMKNSRLIYFYLSNYNKHYV